MFNISQYLDKYKTFGHKERDLKIFLVSIIKKVVGVEINLSDISLQKGEVIIKCSTTIKNSIYIKKIQLLKEIEENVSLNISEIR